MVIGDRWLYRKTDEIKTFQVKCAFRKTLFRHGDSLGSFSEIGHSKVIIKHVLVFVEMFDRWTDVLRRSDCKASYLLHPTVKKALRYCNTITREPTGGLEGEIL